MRSSETERLADIFHALGNIDRLRLVDEIVRSSSGPSAERMTIAQLSERIEVSRFSASRHLAILRESGIVTRLQIGVRCVHVLEPGALELLEDWIYPLVDALEGTGESEIA